MALMAAGASDLTLPADLPLRALQGVLVDCVRAHRCLPAVRGNRHRSEAESDRRVDSQGELHLSTLKDRHQ